MKGMVRRQAAGARTAGGRTAGGQGARAVLARLVAPTAAILAAVAAFAAGAPVAAGAPAVHAGTIIQTIALSAMSPPSPDPAGITYIPETGRLLVSDSEVDEMPIFQGANLYEVDRTGALARTGTTSAYSFEPSGVSWDPTHATLYITDDDAHKVWILGAGPDALLGTPDDAVRSVASPGGSTGDPQGPAYDTATGDLYVVDGGGNTVYRIQPGPNGTIDGIDDVETQFAMPAASGRPGGMTYDPVTNSLFVCDHRSRALYQLDAGGAHLATVDLSALHLTGGCDVAVAPSPTTGRYSFWVTTRGIDNNADATENDGTLWEVSADLLGPSGPAAGAPPVAVPGPGGPAPVPAVQGYRMVASDGGIFAFGSATFRGSTGALELNKPIVSMASTPTGQGYWLVASDGGIFAFGDATFHGSTGNIKLVKPIVSMASTPTGQGYWLVASDGGIFAFGDARFFGSTGNVKLAKRIAAVASTSTGKGYWMVASDGGIFAFGDAAFQGSTGALELAKPIVGMTATRSGRGYWLVASDGGIFAFGDAGFLGSTGNLRLARPVVGMST